MPEREVTIHEFEQLWREDDRAGLRIVCSSGTYVRSLVADLGDAYTRGAAAHADRPVRASTTPTRAGHPARATRWSGSRRRASTATRAPRGARRRGRGAEAEIRPPHGEPAARRAGRGPAARRRPARSRWRAGCPMAALKPFVGFRS